jgi:hypothetical protein
MPAVTSFKPMVFVPSKQQAEIRRMPVRHISAVAHDVIEDAQGGNHWCFYLSTGPKQSVLIDPTPSGTEGSGGCSKAYIVVSSLGCDISTQAQRVDKLAVAPHLTVGNFLDAIVDAGREKYEFEASGRGCRSWINDQIQLFLSLGLIINADEAETTMRNLHSEFKGGDVAKRGIPLNKGMYYK